MRIIFTIIVVERCVEVISILSKLKLHATFISIQSISRGYRRTVTIKFVNHRVSMNLQIRKDEYQMFTRFNEFQFYYISEQR